MLSKEGRDAIREEMASYSEEQKDRLLAMLMDEHDQKDTEIERLNASLKEMTEERDWYVKYIHDNQGSQ